MKVFLSYSHKDEGYKEALETHLALLKRQGLVTTWNDRRITPGQDWSNQISDNLETSDIVLILVSADFIASDYCYSIEMQRAYELHTQERLTLIPVVLRFCDWHSAPFGSIQGLPKDARPVDSFSKHDEAYLQVAMVLRELAEQKGEEKPAVKFNVVSGGEQIVRQSDRRSSNLHVRRTPSDLDRRNFVNEGFRTICEYVLASADELQSRNPDVKVVSERSARDLAMSLFFGGELKSECRMWRADEYGSETIRYSTGQSSGNSWNGEFRVTIEDDQLAFSSMASFSSYSARGKDRLFAEDCAEEFWSEIMAPLQR